MGSQQTTYEDTIELSLESVTEISIIVQDEAKNIKEYKIKVTRANDNNNIQSIEINHTEYLLSSFTDKKLILENVPYSTDKLLFLVHLEDQYASYTTSKTLINDNWLLEEGENRITFYATSEYGRNGETYEVVVTRSNPNQNKDLSNLKIFNENGENLLEGQTIDFKTQSSFQDRGLFIASSPNEEQVLEDYRRHADLLY